MGRNEIFISMINNMALLLLLALIYELLKGYTYKIRNTLTRKASVGFILGLIGILLMLTPWQFSEGVFFDTRSILLSISGLFFGLVPTFIACLMTIAFRILEGGQGMIPGSLLIVSSAGIGLFWRYAENKYGWKNSFLNYYGMGWAVHCVMLLLMLTLPNQIIIPVLKQIGIPILIIYPIGTGLLGRLLQTLSKQQGYRQQIEYSRNKLSTALDSMNDAVCIADSEGNFIETNKAFALFNRFADTSAAVRNLDEYGQLFDIYEDGNLIGIEDWAVSRALHGETGTDAEYTIQSKDTREIWVGSFSYAPIRGTENTITGAVTAARDITSQRNLEEQLRQAQKMDSLGRLVSGITHDFNNMLGAILGYSEIALDKIAPDHSAHNDLQEIIKAANRSAELNKQLLAFSRKQKIVPKKLDINNTIETMLTMLRQIIGEHIELSWIPCENDCFIYMDQSQIVQILTNMCINSRDAVSGTGKITIETSSVHFDAEFCRKHIGFIPGRYVLLAVSDNGCGMDRSTKEKIFEPFFSRKGDRGTGLGLSTVYGIIKQNNGFINVYSEPGRGTTFKIYLPQQEKDDSVQEQSSADYPEPVEKGNGQIILLVDDEPAIRDMTQKMLERLGYKVLSAQKPSEAITYAENSSEPIDLLITDVIMPDMNGKELAESVQNILPNIKILFMSGYTANVVNQQHIFDTFLQKPFTVRELAEKIKKSLQQV